MKLLRPGLVITLALLFFVSVAAVQTPYPSLSFAREPNTEGTTDYVLRPVVGEIQKKVGGDDKPYQIVGAVARPAKEAAILLFVNAQKEIQFRPETNRSVIITVDAVDIDNLEYDVAATNESEPIKLQIANSLVALKDLKRIAKSDSVLLKLGPVLHRIDKDNLSALRHLVSEMEKDQK